MDTGNYPAISTIIYIYATSICICIMCVHMTMHTCTLRAIELCANGECLKRPAMAHGIMVQHGQHY